VLEDTQHRIIARSLSLNGKHAQLGEVSTFSGKDQARQSGIGSFARWDDARRLLKVENDTGEMGGSTTVLKSELSRKRKNRKSK